MDENRVQVPFPTPSSPPKQGSLISVSESTEKWSEFTLEDGTVFRIKPNIVRAVRVDGEYDADGNPAYVLQAQPTVMVMKVDEKLRKKTQ